MTDTQNSTDPLIGTLVITSPHVRPKRWAQRVLRVESLVVARTRTYILIDPDASQQRVRLGADLFEPYTGDMPFGHDWFFHEDTPLDPGVVAVVNGLEDRGIADGTVVVSLGPAKGGLGTKAALLGGDGGRYWPSIPTKNLTVVTATVTA